MKDFAILIGHSPVGKGAVSPFGIPPEYDFNLKVAGFLNDICDVYVHDPSIKSYSKRVQDTANKINMYKYKCLLVLHYNSADPVAHGTEVLYYFKSPGGKKQAPILSKMISQRFSTKDRGAKSLVSSQDRGFQEVFLPTPMALLVEPFFGSNQNDSKLFINKELEYSCVLRKFLNTL